MVGLNNKKMGSILTFRLRYVPLGGGPRTDKGHGIPSVELELKPV